MILPILAYGHPTLRKPASDIPKDYAGLDELIQNMFETMYAASGIGLAAPQIGESLRLFIVDANPIKDDYPELEGFKKIFINPYITEDSENNETMEEGCLSIPLIREVIERPAEITLEYYDENWSFHTEKFSGMAARIIQHEYDHIEGILFVDRISTIRRTLLSRKLKDISTGNVKVDYPMIFPLRRKARVV